jgi:hypothetical protein
MKFTTKNSKISKFVHVLIDDVWHATSMSGYSFLEYDKYGLATYANIYYAF